MPKNSFLILIFLISTACLSQEGEYLFGKVIDSTQQDPIPFASIRVKDRALGVISNIDGTFKIPVRYKVLGEILEISCLGYETKEINVQDLDEAQSNRVALRPSAFELQEAIVSANVKKFSAKQIVKIAVNSIPQNYPQNDFNIVGYYRDYQVKNSSYINLNEAIIKVSDKGFGKRNSYHNQHQLLSYDKNLDFDIDDFAKQPYDYEGYDKIVPNARMVNDGGNEFIMLIMHDAIRNYKEESFSFINDMKSDFINKHSFRLLGKSYYKNEFIYQIEIEFRNDSYLAKGQIFIDTKDFAIFKLDYAVHKLANTSIKSTQSFDYGIVDNASERFSDGFKKMNSEVLYHIQTEYVRDLKGKMFLNYISFYNKFLIQRPAKFYSKFVINLNDNSFRIRLNKLPANLKKIKNNDFKIRHKKALVPIKDFYFLEDERTFVVCPDLNSKKAEGLFENFNYSVSNVTYNYRIRDAEGNKLDERKWEYLHQYREFFSQEIQLKTEAIAQSQIMLKNLPLDSPRQPILSETMTGDYWKNTPLPTIKN